MPCRISYAQSLTLVVASRRHKVNSLIPESELLKLRSVIGIFLEDKYGVIK